MTEEHYRFKVQGLLGFVAILSYGGFLFTWFITVPTGILAAYCVEIVGWVREDARNQRRNESAISRK